MPRRYSDPLVATFATLLAFLLATAAGAAETQFFDSDGTRIAYQVEGEGEPVLLIHGFTASAVLNWGVPGIGKDLARTFQVISIDNRGHGKSDKPEVMEAYGLEMVKDSVRLLDRLGIDSAHVVGYSMGGMIALRMTADYPERVRSVFLGGMGWTRTDEATRRRYEDSDREQTSAALTACFRRFWELGISESELRAIDTPMFVAVGDNDRLLETSVRPLSSIRPDIPVEIIPEATHAGAVFKPALRQAIRRFLEEQAGR